MFGHKDPASGPARGERPRPRLAACRRWAQLIVVATARSALAALCLGLLWTGWLYVVESAHLDPALQEGPFEWTLREYASPGAGWIDAAQRAQPARVVLLVHGLDEPGTIWDDLAPALDGEGHRVLRFEYADDQPIETSGRQLNEALGALHGAGVEGAALVCHSMGGLVARWALSSAEEAGGAGAARPDSPPAASRLAVDRLVLVGTPNGGAPTAPLRIFAEARARVARALTGAGVRQLFTPQDDGAGEAGEDLEIGSPFLRRLDAKRLPASVEVAVIYGAVLPEGAPPAREPGDRRGAGWGLGGVASMLGDGVVPTHSARLDAAAETSGVRAWHRTLLKRVPGVSAGDPPARAIILRLLDKDRKTRIMEP